MKGDVIAIGAACRGRYNPDGTTTQHLELNKEEYSNAITTIAKDAYVFLMDDTYGFNEIRVYEGIYPALINERSGLKEVLINEE